MNRNLFLGRLAVVCLLAVSASSARAALYTGNGVADTEGTVGNGSMDLSVGSGWLSVAFHSGASTFQKDLVLFIDSVPGVGYNGTASFVAYGSTANQVISGYDGTRRSTAVFAPGLYADYAIVITPSSSGLYTLGTGSDFGEPTMCPTSASGSTYTAQFDLAKMGLTDTSASFTFQSSYVGSGGNRTRESFESLTGESGFGHTITFTGYNVFGTPPVPEPVNLALGVFGLVACGGGVVAGLRRWRTSRRAR